MAIKLEKSGVRAPLSDEEDAAGKTYYTNDDFNRIVATFRAKPGTNLDQTSA